VRANQALYNYTVAYGIPCISGKDSMKNDSTIGGRKISIPPTLLFSTIARMPDIRKAVTLDVKRYGDLVYIIGTTKPELGGSEFYAMFDAIGNSAPTVDAESAKRIYQCNADAVDRGLCHSLHTPAFGGLGAALARKAMGGHLGIDVDLAAVPTDPAGLTPVEILFSESNSRFLASVAPRNREAFEALFRDVPIARIGTVTLDPTLVLRWGGRELAHVPVDTLVEAYTGTLD